MSFAAAPPPDAPPPRLWLVPWSLLTNPYCLTAVACALLAVAVSRYLQLDAQPRREPKRRVVDGDVRRLSDTAFVFRGGNASPYTLIDTATATIHSLHPVHPPPDPPHDTPEHAHYHIDGVLYRPHPLAPAAHVRVLEKGIYFQRGRAVRLAFAERDATLVFATRVAADAFVDVLARVRREPRPHTISAFLTTFNVGNSQPPDDLSPWLRAAAGADLVAVGAQECSYTPSLAPAGPPLHEQPSSMYTADEDPDRNDSEESADSSPLLVSHVTRSESLTTIPSASPPVSAQSSGHTSAKDHWHALLVRHFPDDQYACVTRQVAWDRCLTIFVRQHLLPYVSHVRSDTANVGLGRVAGNKGAIGTRFSVFDTDFVIINAHLAAHHKEVNRRNEDFSSIAHGLHALRDNPDVDVFASAVHHTFWMGDLNYRINLERDNVLKLVQEKSWSQLQAADQLVEERSAGRSFQGFREGKTNFPPTYRYEYGSRRYSDVKKRVPSWCDRILYRSLPGCKLELKEYKPADEILTSDHSPVSALFTASLTHTSGKRDLDSVVTQTRAPPVEPQKSMLLASPRSLSVRSFMPTPHGPKTLQLIFTSLSATDFPEMDHGGRRIAVAKALRIENHLAWKKHEELGDGQHADPYCTFHGTAVAELDEGEYRSTTITASQNPVWKSEDIPHIDLVGNDPQQLRTRYVVITVKDENPARRDGTIGSAILWLEGTGKEDGTKFTAAVMRGGRRRGELAGEYVVR